MVSTLPSDPREAREVVRAARHRRRMEARRRKQLVAGVMAGAGVIAVLGLGRLVFFGGAGTSPSAQPRREAPMLVPPSQPADPPPDAGPAKGEGTFAYATTAGPVAGAAGAVKKYRVAVENGSGQQADA